MDLRHVIRLTKPVARVTYEPHELDGSGLDDALQGLIERTRSPEAV
jgi:hypothetical protein